MCPPSAEPVDLDVRARNVAICMASLDGVDFTEIFKQRGQIDEHGSFVSQGGIPMRIAGGVRRSTMRQRQERQPQRHESMEIVSFAPPNVVEQTSSWWACPQKAVAGEVPKIQRRSVGRID